MTASPAATLDQVRSRLRRFAEREAAGSPLYAHLAGQAADDQEIASLLTAAPAQFAYPTLLFAAVHRVLQAEPFHELANYYPSLGGSFGVDEGTWSVFRTYVTGRADRIRRLIATRTTQTNEVRRAALLYPAVAMVAKQAGGPISLLEVGASAGLLLGLDRYGYRYQTEQAGQLVAGPARSPVGLHCTLELAAGAQLPMVPRKLAVAARIGLDRAPVDLTDEEQYAWLEACVWADQPDRLRLLGAAAAMARRYPVDVLAGDAVDDLGNTVVRLPADLPVVVLTSSLLQYLPAQRQVAFVDALADLARTRLLWWISQEPYGCALEHVLPGRRDDLEPRSGQPFGVLGAVTWSGGSPRAAALARTSWHGQRLHWLSGAHL